MRRPFLRRLIQAIVILILIFYAWSSAFVIAFKNAKLSLELHGFLRLLPF